MRVLIMTASFGTGHNIVAEALAEAACAGGHTAQILDGLATGMPVLGSLMTSGFIRLLKTAPAIYRTAYTHAEEPGIFDSVKHGGMSTLARLMWHKLAPTLAEFEPDVLVCTHPFVLGAMAWLRRHGRLNVPVVGVLTDFAPHAFWIHAGVDAYCVGTPEMARIMCGQGVPGDQVFATGIPVRQIFTAPPDRHVAAHAHGLNPDRPTVLVMGGGLGLGPIREAVSTICEAGLSLQLLVVTGHNEALYRELQPLVGHSVLRGVSLRLYGFVPDMHVLMAASDLAVTKPGAVTAAEALAVGLPMLLVHPIPGHEERNQRVLTAAGAARRVAKVADLPRALSELLADPLELAAMRRATRRLGSPAAAGTIIRQVADLFAQRSCAPLDLAVGSGSLGRPPVGAETVSVR